MLNTQKVHVIIVISLFFIFGWLLFTYRIVDVPPGINGDEAVIGYNAALIAKNGNDSNGRFLPLFTAMEGSNDWKQPVTLYSAVLAFKIFGVSYFTLRAVGVFFALFSGAVIFFLIRELVGLKAAIFGVLLFVTTPIIMIQSHLALENIAPVPFIAFWLWMIVKYSKKAKTRYLVFAGISLGLSLYSYLGLRLIMPPLAAATVVLVCCLGRRLSQVVIHRVLIFILVSIPFLVIFLMIKNQYPGSFLGQYRPYQIASYQQLALPYISSFDPSFLFLKGDATPYHSTGKQGMFLLASLPLFVLGIVKILQGKKLAPVFILITFFLIPVLYGFASDIHRGSRLLSLIPSYIVICSFGIMVLIKMRNKLCRFLLISLMFFLIIINFTDFLNDYWYEYPKRVKSEFSKPYQVVFEEAFNLSKTNNLNLFIQSDFRMQNPLAEKFFEQVYFPDGLKLWKDEHLLPQNSVVIVSDYILSQKKDVNYKTMGDGDFGILINLDKNGNK